MDFVILDTSGNVIDSFNKDGSAQDALLRLVQEHPDEAANYLLIAYDDEGMPVGEVTHGTEYLVGRVVIDSCFSSPEWKPQVRVHMHSTGESQIATEFAAWQIPSTMTSTEVVAA